MMIDWIFVRGFQLMMISCLLCACDGDDAAIDETGVCIVVFEDALLTLDSAVVVDANEGSEVNVSSLTISNIVHEGRAINIAAISGQTNTDIVLNDDGLSATCNLPCFLLESEGSYSMLISVDGYDEQTLAFSAEYETFEGGCPAYYRGGTTRDVVLSL